MLLATKSVWTATVRCLRFPAFCGNSDLGTRLSRAPQHLAPKREQLSNSRGMFPQILMLTRAGQFPISPIAKVLAGLEVIYLPVCINQGNTLNLNARREALPLSLGAHAFCFRWRSFV
jgi:hypothetical protein